MGLADLTLEWRKTYEFVEIEKGGNGLVSDHSFYFAVENISHIC
jgi:hypothetical protein